MAEGIKAEIKGLPDLRVQLRAIPDKLRRRYLRNWLAAGARVVQKEARRLAPVISSSNQKVRRGIRKPGTVRDAIRVRTSKESRAQGNVGVFVNVKPAKGAKFSRGFIVAASDRGAKSPNDPYYWSILEFGHGAGPSRRQLKSRKGYKKKGAIRAYKYLQGGGKKLGAAVDVFFKAAAKTIQKFNDRSSGA